MDRFLENYIKFGGLYIKGKDIVMMFFYCSNSKYWPQTPY